MESNKMLGKCPICDNDITITEMSCRECGTVVKGKFEPCKFCKLSKEQKNFIEVFIKNRGNIKEIEKELGISYPTVRNKIDQIIVELGYNVIKENTFNKKDILDKLSRGDITKDEAIKMLSE